MPGRKRYDAVNAAVAGVQLPTFVSKDGSFYLDPAFDGSAWESLKTAADDIVAGAQDLQDHPHLHDSHQDLAGEIGTAATSFQGAVMTSNNQWRGNPEGQEVKQTEDMVGMGNMLQFMRSKLDSFDQEKLDASTALFGS